MKCDNYVFKARRKDNGEWIKGDLLHNIDCTKIRERETDVQHIARSYEVEPKTVELYTGLTNCKKQMIFGGDILVDVFVDEWAIVEWSYGSFLVKGMKSNRKTDVILVYNVCNVIGNIHDDYVLGYDLTNGIMGCDFGDE